MDPASSMSAPASTSVPASSGATLRAVENGAYSGLAAVGGLQANLLIGVGAVFGLLLIYAGFMAKNATNLTVSAGGVPGTAPGSVAWGLVAFGVAVGVGSVALGRWMKHSKKREALVGAAGLMRLL